MARLFHHHRFVMGQRSHYILRVAVVAGKNKDSVCIFVLQQLGGLHGAGKAKQLPGGFRRHA
jgi:hypothetical protein